MLKSNSLVTAMVPILRGLLLALLLVAAPQRSTVAYDSYAYFHFCNTGSKVFWLAIREVIADVLVPAYKSNGWYKVEPGDCRDFSRTNINLDHFWFTATFKDGEILDLTPEEGLLGYGYGEPSRDRYCVHPTDGFRLYGTYWTEDPTSVCSPGYVAIPFTLYINGSSYIEHFTYDINSDRVRIIGNVMGSDNEATWTSTVIVIASAAAGLLLFRFGWRAVSKAGRRQQMAEPTLALAATNTSPAIHVPPKAGRAPRRAYSIGGLCLHVLISALASLLTFYLLCDRLPPQFLSLGPFDSPNPNNPELALGLSLAYPFLIVWPRVGFPLRRIKSTLYWLAVLVLALLVVVGAFALLDELQ